MRKVLTLACLLAMAHHIAAQCNLPTYSYNLVPECSQNDQYIRWPNYENQETYYQCAGVGVVKTMTCPKGTYFCYVMQDCVPCNQMIPAVPCQQLRTQNTPKCIAFEGGETGSTGPTNGPTLPTPNYPTKTTKPPTVKPPTNAPTTKPPTVKPTPAPTIPTIPTPPTSSPGGQTSDIPPPPSPVTNNPNIPMPPTPPPTPPSVPVTPPNVPSAPAVPSL